MSPAVNDISKPRLPYIGKSFDGQIQFTHEIVYYLDIHEFKHFPAIAKPLGEGSSKGIRAKNLVNNQEELKHKIENFLCDIRKAKR